MTYSFLNLNVLEDPLAGGGGGAKVEDRHIFVLVFPNS